MSSKTSRARRYYAQRAYAFDLLGRVCVNCGSADADELVLDHVDRTQKRIRFCDAGRVSWERFIAELKNAQVLCCICHGSKSFYERYDDSPFEDDDEFDEAWEEWTR